MFNKSSHFYLSRFSPVFAGNGRETVDDHTEKLFVSTSAKLSFF